MHLYNEYFDTPNDIIYAFGKYLLSVHENHNTFHINYNHTVPPKVVF